MDEPPPEPAADAEALAEDDPRAAVLAADRAFAERARLVGTAQAFREFMHPEDGRLIPPTGAPVIGEQRIYEIMGGAAPGDGQLLWEPVEAFAADSGEFAVTWGRARFVPTAPEAAERTGGYVTVWRKDEDGRWLALLDIGNMPAKE